MRGTIGKPAPPESDMDLISTMGDDRGPTLRELLVSATVVVGVGAVAVVLFNLGLLYLVIAGFIGLVLFGLVVVVVWLMLFG